MRPYPLLDGAIIGRWIPPTHDTPHTPDVGAHGNAPLSAIPITLGGMPCNHRALECSRLGRIAMRSYPLLGGVNRQAVDSANPRNAAHTRRLGGNHQQCGVQSLGGEFRKPTNRRMIYPTK